MSTPKVTILVALYKASQYVESKIKSLEYQSFQDYNVIFLNCLNLEKEYELILSISNDKRYIHLNFTYPITIYESWNVGIKATQSKYIVNYNADDIWHPDYLRECVEHLDSTENSIVNSEILITDIPNQLYPKWSWIDKYPPYKFPTQTCGPCPMWRRSVHAHVGLFDGTKHVIADGLFWEKLLINNYGFGLIHKPLVLYYINPDSLERRRDKSGILLSDIDRS